MRMVAAHSHCVLALRGICDEDGGLCDETCDDAIASSQSKDTTCGLRIKQMNTADSQMQLMQLMAVKRYVSVYRHPTPQKQIPNLRQIALAGPFALFFGGSSGTAFTVVTLATLASGTLSSFSTKRSNLLLGLIDAVFSSTGTWTPL